jgi:phosphoenolpyruvate carboxylase
MQNSQYISPIRGIIAKNPNNLQFSSLKPKDEPYRRLLMAVRRRCYRTKVSMEAQYLGDSAELLLERDAFGTYIYNYSYIFLDLLKIMFYFPNGKSTTLANL